MIRDWMITSIWTFAVIAFGIWLGWTAAQKGRFVPVTPNTALDTATGHLCWSYDPIGGQDKIPVCNAK